MLTNQSIKNHPLYPEYRIMEKRYEKLVLEGKELQKEHDENVTYYITNHISDNKWQSYLEDSTSHLAIASVRLKITKDKMVKIREVLRENTA